MCQLPFIESHIRGMLSNMGVASARIRLENPKRPELKPIDVEAMADPGALFLCIPEEVRIQLQLEPTSSKDVITADGSRIRCRYVGSQHEKNQR
jgi:hypothetical protein